MSNAKEYSGDSAWEAYAKSYDQILPLIPFYQDAVKRHVKCFVEAGAMTVVDIGAATGNVAFRLSARQVDVTAIDFSPAMVRRMEDKKANGTAARVTAIQMNAECLSP